MNRVTAAVGLAVALSIGAGAAWLKSKPVRTGKAVTIDPEDDDGSARTEPPPRGRGKAKTKTKTKAKGKRKGRAARRRPTPVAQRPTPPDGAPNIVLVFGCTVRKDQLGAYGGLATVTPWLDDLAADGTRFADALSVSSWTRASAVGVLTGNHPLAYNLPEPGPKQSERVLPERATTLAESLAEAGWFTVGVTSNPNLNANYGMAQGFDRYRDSDEKGFRKRRLSGVDVGVLGMSFLDERTEAELTRPFFMQLMMIDAHHPRTPTPAQIAPFKEGVARPLAEYRATLHELDEALEQLDRGLASRGADASNTLFVFVTDHGEGLNLPVHHGPGHGKKMYPSTVAIPWIVRGPGVKESAVVEGLASGVDVMPTVLGLVGLDGPGKTAGRDLSAWVSGKRTDRLPRQHAYSVSMFHVANVAAVWTPEYQCQKWFQGDRDKEVTGCFDRLADPGFSEPFEDGELTAELVRWRQAQLTLGQGVQVERAEVKSAQQEQLELLGYLEE